MQEELQKIYDSEINISISWSWDGGIDLKLGHEMHGSKFDEEGAVDKVEEIIPWLQKNIKKHCQGSTYVKNLNNRTH